MANPPKLYVPVPAPVVDPERHITRDWVLLFDQLVARLAAVATGTVLGPPLASAASRLLGRGSAGGAGAWEELTVGTGATITGTVVTAKPADVVLRGTRAAQPAASAVLAGTLYGVTDEEVLERSNGTTWESYAALSANVALLDADNVFTHWNETRMAQPATYWRETDVGTDLKVWRIVVDNSVFYLQALNDAVSSVLATVWSVDRQGLFSLPAGQLGFPSTPNPSSNANTLDTYAEGTWTPTLVCSGGGTPTYTARDGTYTKIGKGVFIEGRVQLSLLVGGAGTVSIQGLPFTCGSLNSTIQVGYGTTATAGVWLGGYVAAGTTAVVLNFKTAASTSWAAGLTAADAGASFDIVFSLHYQAAT